MKYVVYYIYNCIFKILKSKFVKTKFFLVCIIVLVDAVSLNFAPLAPVGHWPLLGLRFFQGSKPCKIYSKALGFKQDTAATEALRSASEAPLGVYT